MWRYPAVLLALSVVASSPGHRAAAAPKQAFEGRWDIAIQTPNGDRPSWLEIWESGRDALVGRMTGISGSARPISSITLNGDSLRFAIPHQWEAGDGDLIVTGKLDGDKISGSMRFPVGEKADGTAEGGTALKGDMTRVGGVGYRMVSV